MKSSEFNPHGFITICNTGGIEIMLNRSNDGVYYRFNYGQDNLNQEEIFEAEIEYTITHHEEEESLAYFAHGKEINGTMPTLYFLNEAMRIN